jgi:hypothetical protein
MYGYKGGSNTFFLGADNPTTISAAPYSTFIGSFSFLNNQVKVGYNNTFIGSAYTDTSDPGATVDTLFWSGTFEYNTVIGNTSFGFAGRKNPSSNFKRNTVVGHQNMRWIDYTGGNTGTNDVVSIGSLNCDYAYVNGGNVMTGGGYIPTTVFQANHCLFLGNNAQSYIPDDGNPGTNDFSITNVYTLGHNLRFVEDNVFVINNTSKIYPMTSGMTHVLVWKDDYIVNGTPDATGSTARLAPMSVADFKTNFGITYLSPYKTRVVNPNAANDSGVGGYYKTIAGALGAANSGDLVYVSPGTYNENNLTIGADNIELRGSGDSTIVSGVFYAGTTMLNTSADNITISNMKFLMTCGVGAEADVTFYGIVIGAAPTGVHIKNCSIEIDMSALNTTDSAYVYGIIGSPANPTGDSTCQNCTFRTVGKCTGAMYCAFSSNNMSFDSCSLICDRTTGNAGTYTAIHQQAGGVITATDCVIGGSDYDCYIDTTASLTVGKGTILRNSTTNSTAITNLDGGVNSMLFVSPGQHPATGSYFYIGTYTGTTSAISYPLGKTSLVYGLYVSLTTGGSNGSADYTVYKNGSSTTITCSIQTGESSASDTEHGVTFSATDKLSIQCSNVTNAADMTDVVIRLFSY